MKTISSLKNNAATLVEDGRLLEASSVYEQICNIDENDADTWFRLGDIYWRLNRHKKAAECCRRSINLDPDNPVIHHKLGVMLHSSGVLPEAMKYYQRALELNPYSPDTYFHLGNLFKDQSRFVAAEEMYRNTLRLDIRHARAHCCLGDMLKARGLIGAAVASYDSALKLDPGLSEATWCKLRALPIIPMDTDELEAYRLRYAEGLKQLNKQLSLRTSEEQQSALRGAMTSTGFMLQYQGRNDLALQQLSGEMIVKIMAASFPQWSRPVSMPALAENEKIRVGYASSFLRNHNGAVWLLGWLQHMDKSRFEIFCYHTGGPCDDKTEEFMALSDHFYHIPNNLRKPCEQIVADQLHILVYPELGMYAPTQLMAGLHLAPIQCTSWGHPITSGLSTINYWLSSDLMEPENGQEHYSETLIRLPNLAISYSQDQCNLLRELPLEKGRSDFNLREDAILYFCSQSLYKYLPEYDHLYPEIALRVPDAQFIFITSLNKDVEEKFKKRIGQAFDRAGLDAENYCIVLPRLSPEDYLTMNRLVDVFLDNPSWSGANTTLTAIDCDLPVVTWPTTFMRGRHSYAILKMAGLTETITNNADEYIKMATRLGTDHEWRHAIVLGIREAKNKIYNDTSCVRGLEDFFVRAVISRQGQ